MATSLFFLSQLRSGCRPVRKSSNPGAGAPVLAATMTSKDILMLRNDDNDDGNGDATFLFISTPFGLSDCPKILQSRCRRNSLGGQNDDEGYPNGAQR